MQKVKVKLTGRHGHNIEGDIIECHPNLLPILEAQGKIASQEKEPEKEKEVKTKKTKKMKKIILICLMSLITFSVFSQSTTKTLPPLGRDSYYLKYTGSAWDSLTSNRDTLRYVIQVNKEYPVLFYFNSVLNKISGIDTTVIVNVYGKVFSGQSWTLITAANALSSEVNTNTNVVSSLLTEPSYTGTITTTGSITDTISADTTKKTLPYGELYYWTPTYKVVQNSVTTSGRVALSNYYRYIMLEFIRTGDDHVGVGSKVTSFELRIFKRSF